MRRSSKRKLPGPIGLLPDAEFEYHSQEEIANLGRKLKQNNTPKDQEQDSSQICSPCSQEHYPKLWKEMCCDLNFQVDDSECLINKYNIQWLKHNVEIRKCNTWRTPFLCGSIKVIDTADKDATVVIGDKSGEVNGIICESVVEKYGSWLNPGSVLVLKQVSVLCPKSNLRKPYLNITMSTLMRLYAYDSHSAIVQKFELVEWNEAIIKKNINEAKYLQSKILIESELSPTQKPSTCLKAPLTLECSDKSPNSLYTPNIISKSNSIPPLYKEFKNVVPASSKAKNTSAKIQKYENKQAVCDGKRISDEVSNYSLSSMIATRNNSENPDPVSNFLDNMDEDDWLLASLDSV